MIDTGDDVILVDKGLPKETPGAVWDGDISYTDEAIYADKLSIVYDDIHLTRSMQNTIREFICNHPTVYCGTHTQQGLNTTGTITEYRRSKTHHVCCHTRSEWYEKTKLRSSP